MLSTHGSHIGGHNCFFFSKLNCKQICYVPSLIIICVCHDTGMKRPLTKFKTNFNFYREFIKRSVALRNTIWNSILVKVIADTAYKV